MSTLTRRLRVLVRPELDLSPELRQEAEAGVESFLVDLRTKVRQEDGGLTAVEPRGFAVHWRCHGKGLGTTYLYPTPPDAYTAWASARVAGDRMVVEDGVRIRFRCPVCRRSPVVRGERVVGMLVDLARAYPDTGVRRVTADIRILD